VIFERRRIARGSDGAVRLRLPDEERTLLRALPSQLERLLDEPDDPSLRRLFPAAYEDAADEDEYRRLTRDELLEGCRRALATLAATADRDRLTAEEAEAWLAALNALRLVLGTRLDVREDTPFEAVDPGDPRAQEIAIYLYLSWLQEQLVAALAAGIG
jgi:hypothetical protein